VGRAEREVTGTENDRARGTPALPAKAPENDLLVVDDGDGEEEADGEKRGGKGEAGVEEKEPDPEARG